MSGEKELKIKTITLKKIEELVLEDDSVSKMLVMREQRFGFASPANMSKLKSLVAVCTSNPCAAENVTGGSMEPIAEPQV